MNLRAATDKADLSLDAAVHVRSHGLLVQHGEFFESGWRREGTRAADLLQRRRVHEDYESDCKGESHFGLLNPSVSLRATCRMKGTPDGNTPLQTGALLRYDRFA